MKIKRGDTVEIRTGRDAGKRGKVLRALPTSGRVIVESLNMVKRHNRPKRSGEKGQRIEVPAAIPVSRVSLVCPSCQKATRIGVKQEGKSRVRVCKKCQQGM